MTPTSIMKRVLARLARLRRDLALRHTHPLIVRSLVSDVSGIDRTARIMATTISGKAFVGANATLDHCHIRANERVAVGARSILTGPIRIVADMNPVTIGKFCSFAPEVSIWESLHDTGRLSTYYVFSSLFEEWNRDAISKGAINIGNDVWIGTRALVLSGVTIGDGAVVGAGSVVTRDVLPYSIVAGAPADIVKFRFSDSTRARLLELRWWDWSEDKIRRNRPLFEGDLVPEALDRIE